MFLLKLSKITTMRENERCSNKVGFIVKNSFNDYVSEFKPISDHIAMMKIREKYNKLVIT